MSFFPLEFGGEPYAIGHRRGSLFRDIIKAIAETRLTKIPDKDDKVRLAVHIENVLKNNYPELVEELRGMADGSGIEYDRMLLLNAWWDEPWYCSNVALTDTALGPVLASALDIGHSPYLLMMHYKPKEGYPFVTVCSPEFLGAARAMNARGLCLGGSTTKTTDKGLGFPRYILCRIALQYCSTVGEVVELFGRFKEGLSNPGNYMFVDRDGGAVVIEQTNTTFTVRTPVNGGIACANHYETAEARQYQYMGSDWAWILRNSEERYRSLTDFVNTADKNKPTESMESLLKSHGPGGICQHGGKDELCATVAFVMMPRQKEFRASQPVGFYCQSQFIGYRVFDGPH